MSKNTKIDLSKRDNRDIFCAVMAICAVIVVALLIILFYVY